MVVLEVEKKEAFETQKIVSAEEFEAQKSKEEATKLASQALQSVAESNKILEVTLLEVQKLKKDHISEIKSLSNPPRALKVILGGIVILNLETIKKAGGNIIMKNLDLGKKEEDYFETAKRHLLNDASWLLDLLMHYNKNNIPQALIQRLEQKIMPDPDFTLERAKTCSTAIQYFFLWIKAMYDYNKVYLETKPLRDQLEATQKLLEEKTKYLKEKKDMLDKVNAKI